MFYANYYINYCDYYSTFTIFFSIHVYTKVTDIKYKCENTTVNAMRAVKNKISLGSKDKGH